MDSEITKQNGAHGDGAVRSMKCSADLDEGCLERLQMKAPCDWCNTPMSPDNIISVGREPSGPGATVIHLTCYEQRSKRTGDPFAGGWRPNPPNVADQR